MKTHAEKLSAPQLKCLPLFWLASITLFVCSQTVWGAGIVENFTYANGSLTAVSGSAWKSWGGGGDATVVNGTARYEDTTDVIRAFPAVLAAPGDTATISFTMRIAVANTTEGYEMAFEPSSEPFGFGNTNYGSGLALGFDYLDGPSGMSTIQVAEGSGNFSTSNQGNNIVQIGTMSAGVTHTISISLARGATNTSYSLFLDNTLLRSSTFVINDARAINSVEFDQAGAQGTAAGFAIIDDLVIVPEPASSLLIGLGLCAGFVVRQRPQNAPGRHLLE
jgi:hypothetical protein